MKPSGTFSVAFAAGSLIAESIKITKADVYRYCADPASAPTPTATLISKDFADQRRKPTLL